MKKKKIAMLLAASTMIVNYNSIIVSAQTDENAQDYNLSAYSSRANDKLSLSSGKEIRVNVNASSEVILEQADALDSAQWSFVDNLGKAEVRELEETTEGGFTVTYIRDSFKYTRVYDKNLDKIQEEKMVGVEVLNYDDQPLTLDLIVDEVNFTTTIINSNGNEVVEGFVPTLAVNFGMVNISLIGKDKNDKTSVIVVTEDKKVIQSKDAAKILGDEYSEVRAIGSSEVDDEKFIISGYAVKKSNPNQRDGFVIQFDGQGNKDGNIKIIPASAENNYDAAINIVFVFESGNVMLAGDNLGRMYINALDYNDPRTVKESLSLTNGKTYMIVESEIMTLSSNKTYTVKCVDGEFEYDIETYENVKDIKLVPGNDDQVLVALQKDNDTTEVAVIDTNADLNLDGAGYAVGMISNPVVLKNADGPILNIDINKIKVDGNGQVLVNKTGEGDSEGVILDGVKPGNPVEVKPNPPVEGGDEEDTPNQPEVPPTDEEEVIPPKDEETEKPGDNEAVKPEDKNEIVNVDKGKKVIFDVSKPNNIKIVSSKLKGKEVDYIVVNGVKITKSSMARLIYNDTLVDYNNEYYTVVDGGIILYSKLFEALQLDTNKDYEIGVVFTDGATIENLTTIKVVDPNNTVATKPSENDTTEKYDVVEKEETSNEAVEGEKEKAPKTGVAAQGVPLMLAMMTSVLGTVFSRRKK